MRTPTPKSNHPLTIRRAIQRLSGTSLDESGAPRFAGLTITNAISASANSVVFQPATDSTTFLQVLDADGGTPILNVDSTNERVGIGTASPGEKAEISGGHLRVTSGASTSYINAVNTGGEVAFGSTGDEFRVAPTKANLSGGGIRLLVSSAGVGINTTDLASGIALTINKSTSQTDNIQDMVALTRQTLGTAQAGLGGGYAFYIENDNGDLEYVAGFGGLIEDPTDGDERGGLFFRVRMEDEASTPVERMRLSADGFLGLNETAPETTLELTHATPYITLHNSTHEDTDGGRESRIIFKGERLDTTEDSLAQIQSSHDGAGADSKGDLIFSTNNGAALTEALRIDSAQLATFAGNIVVPDGGTLGTSGPLLTFDDTNNYLEITGCDRIGFGTATPLSTWWFEATGEFNDLYVRSLNASGRAMVQQSANAGAVFTPACSMRVHGPTYVGDGPYFGSALAGTACYFSQPAATGMLVGTLTNYPVIIGVNDTKVAEFTTTPYTFNLEYPLRIKEAAAAVADTEAYGQIWVKNTAPCELWFTDDAGTDTQLTEVDKTMFIIPASSMYGDNDAQLVAGDAAAPHTMHKGRSVLAFDDTDEEAAITPELVMPRKYRGGTLKATVHFYMESDNTNDAALDVFVEAKTPNTDTLDLETATSWDSANSGTMSVNGTTAGDPLSLTITLTNADSVAAGDLVRFGVRRDCDSADDDASDDLFIACMEIWEDR